MYLLRGNHQTYLQLYIARSLFGFKQQDLSSASHNYVTPARIRSFEKIEIASNRSDRLTRRFGTPPHLQGDESTEGVGKAFLKLIQGQHMALSTVKMPVDTTRCIIDRLGWLIVPHY